jgi:hypothetical protein
MGCYPTYDCCLAGSPRGIMSARPSPDSDRSIPRGEALRRSRCEPENPLRAVGFCSEPEAATPVIALLNADLSENFDESLRLRKSARKIAMVTRCGRWGCACRKWARAVFKCSRRNSFEQALPERNRTRRLRPEHRLHLRRAAARTRTCHPLRDERLRHQLRHRFPE